MQNNVALLNYFLLQKTTGKSGPEERYKFPSTPLRAVQDEMCVFFVFISG
jgi:hypothetical protein